MLANSLMRILSIRTNASARVSQWQAALYIPFAVAMLMWPDFVPEITLFVLLVTVSQWLWKSFSYQPRLALYLRGKVSGLHTKHLRRAARVGFALLCILVVMACSAGYWWQLDAAHQRVDSLHSNRHDRYVQAHDDGGVQADHHDGPILAQIKVTPQVKASLYAVGITPVEERIFPSDRHRKIIGSSE